MKKSISVHSSTFLLRYKQVGSLLKKHAHSLVIILSLSRKRKNQKASLTVSALLFLLLSLLRAAQRLAASAAAPEVGAAVHAARSDGAHRLLPDVEDEIVDASFARANGDARKVVDEVVPLHDELAVGLEVIGILVAGLLEGVLDLLSERRVPAGVGVGPTTVPFSL